MAEPGLARSAEKLKDSASKMERGTARMEFSADRRTGLAADRTVFAAERTYAAWVRTGLVAMASGIGARPLLEGIVANWLIVTTGSVLVLFSAFCFGAAVWRNFYRPAPPPSPDAARIHPAVLMVVNGILILVALAAFIDILFGRVVR
jgi:putative membrane protein